MPAPADDTATGPGRAGLPPLAGEAHVCPVCPLSYAEVSTESALAAIGAVPVAFGAAVPVIPAELLRVRPEPQIWSIVEYVCHVRDVFLSFTIRLHRARTEDRPALEPMLSDLRARRFRYIDADLSAVLAELEMAVVGFRDEAARYEPDQWSRTVTRLPTEERTAQWLVIQAMHEGQHHLGDVHRVHSTVAAGPAAGGA